MSGQAVEFSVFPGNEAKSYSSDINERLIVAPTYPPIDKLIENKIGINNRVKNKPGKCFPFNKRRVSRNVILNTTRLRSPLPPSIANNNSTHRIRKGKSNFVFSGHILSLHRVQQNRKITIVLTKNINNSKPLHNRSKILGYRVTFTPKIHVF